MANVTVFPGFVPIEDVVCDRGKNGLPALGAAIATIANTMNGIAFSGGCVYCFCDGDADTNSQYQLTQVVNTRHRATVNLNGDLLLTPGPSATQQTGQGVRWSVRVSEGVYTTYDTAVQSDPSSDGTAAALPEDLQELKTATTTTDGTDAFTPGTTFSEVWLGSMTSNGPGLVAGCVTIPETSAVDASSATPPYMPTDFMHANGEIVATSTGTSNIDRLRSLFLHNWNFKRPQIGWSIQSPGTNFINVGTVPA